MTFDERQGDAFPPHFPSIGSFRLKTSILYSSAHNSLHNFTSSAYPPLPARIASTILVAMVIALHFTPAARRLAGHPSRSFSAAKRAHYHNNKFKFWPFFTATAQLVHTRYSTMAGLAVRKRGHKMFQYLPTNPSGQLQLYWATPSMHVPPFAQGFEKHSSQFVWHCTPV